MGACTSTTSALLLMTLLVTVGCVAPTGISGGAREAEAREYVMRSHGLGARGDFTGSMAAATKAIELNPKDAEAFFARGMGYETTEQHDRAIADFEKALQLNPDHGFALYHKARSYEKAARFKEAAEARAALKLWCERSAAARQHPVCR